MSTLAEDYYSFDDGVKAGDLVLRLIEKIDPCLTDDCQTFLAADQLSELLNRYREVSTSCRPMPCVEGLLSRLIKPSTLESSLLTIWGADALWENQKRIYPICEIGQDLGFVQFGFWRGDADGDAWMIDTTLERLSILSLDVCEFDADQLRLSCTDVFTSPWQWFSFLRCDAWERGWIPENK